MNMDKKLMKDKQAVDAAVYTAMQNLQKIIIAVNLYNIDSSVLYNRAERYRKIIDEHKNWGNVRTSQYYVNIKHYNTLPGGKK